MFRSLAILGRPIGGIRPRRLTNIAGARGYTDRQHPSSAFGWWKDRWGSKMLLSPYYETDRCIIAYGTKDLDLGGYLESCVRPGMVCFDIGANIGEVTLHMARLVGSEGHVFAFEPIPRIRERLRQNVEHNAVMKIVSIEPYALSDKSGPAIIHYADEDARNQGMGSLLIEDASLTLSLEIQTMRMDDFVAKANIRRLDLIKVDIQGAEQMMLDGARETLKRFSPAILLEVAGPDLVAIGSSASELLAKVEALGYRVHAVEFGKRGRLLRASDLPADVYWSNVICENTG